MKFGKFLKNVFTKNIPLKAIALVLSFLTLFLIHSIANFKKTEEQPETESCITRDYE